MTLDDRINQKVRDWMREAVEWMRVDPMSREARGPAALKADEAEFGAECQTILENRAFQVFWAKIDQKMTDDMLALPLKADDERRRLATAVQTVRQLRAFLLKSAQAGRMAEAELQKLTRGR